jgi:hypothetical protein
MAIHPPDLPRQQHLKNDLTCCCCSESTPLQIKDGDALGSVMLDKPATD